MKKDVSLLNVMLDLGPSEQMGEKVNLSVYSPSKGINIDHKSYVRGETIQNSHLAGEVNTCSYPSSPPVSHTDSITGESDQTFHRPNTPTTSHTSHVEDHFYISPTKVQVVRTFNYLGVTDKLKSLPPIRPDSIHFRQGHAWKHSLLTIYPISRSLIHQFRLLALIPSLIDLLLSLKKVCLTRIIPFPYLVGSTLQAVSTQGQINTPRRIPSRHSFPCTATCRKMNSSPGIDQWSLR